MHLFNSSLPSRYRPPAPLFPRPPAFLSITSPHRHLLTMTSPGPCVALPDLLWLVKCIGIRCSGSRLDHARCPCSSETRRDSRVSVASKATAKHGTELQSSLLLRLLTWREGGTSRHTSHKVVIYLWPIKAGLPSSKVGMSSS